MIDHEAAVELWDRYKRGESKVFTRRLYTLQGQQTFDEIRRKYARDGEFKQTVDRYVEEFERLLAEVSRDDRDSMLTKTYLTSETGKVYTMLAHASGRLGLKLERSKHPPHFKSRKALPRPSPRDVAVRAGLGSARELIVDGFDLELVANAAGLDRGTSIASTRMGASRLADASCEAAFSQSTLSELGCRSRLRNLASGLRFAARGGRLPLTHRTMSSITTERA